MTNKKGNFVSFRTFFREFDCQNARIVYSTVWKNRQNTITVLTENEHFFRQINVCTNII